MNSTRLGWTIVVVGVLVVSLLFWFGVQLNQQQTKACEQACGTFGDGFGCGMQACPYHNSNTNFLILSIVGVLIAFVTGLGSYVAFAKKEKIIEQKEYDLTSLSEEEKKIFHYIKDKKEGVYQHAIGTEFNLSKVQVTRLLDKLEGIGLIERRRRGLANVVAVK